ncbi:MAG: S8/S53 family peptidase [Bacteriovoracales bacterium]|nr:S8/S53 family peptidase [Bacteriovoracales bacterium]
MNNLFPTLVFSTFLIFKAPPSPAASGKTPKQMAVKFHGFLIDASRPIHRHELMKRIPPSMRAIPWIFSKMDGEEFYYELRPPKDRAPMGTQKIWDISYLIAEVDGVEFCDPVFLPTLSGKKQPFLSPLMLAPLPAEAEAKGVIPGSDGPFGRCSWPKEKRSRYTSKGQNYCYPKSSDDFDWADKKFLHFKKAWTLTRARGEQVFIGHPDSGYLPHPQVIRNILTYRGINFIEKELPPLDKWRKGIPIFGHGTATASLISGRPKNQQNVEFWSQNFHPNHESGLPWPPFGEGVAPKSKIIPYRVIKRSVVNLTFFSLMRAIKKAVEQDVKVISISLGSPLPLPWVHRAIKQATRKGVVVIAASGNYVPARVFKKFVVWPSRYQDVISVAATDSDGLPWRYSSRGKQVHISAPGVGVWSANSWFKNNRVYFSIARKHGTSFSTAYVAGAAALFLSHHGHDNLQKIYKRKNISKLFLYMLKNHAYNRPGGWDTQNYGVGILDVYKLISAPLPDPALITGRSRASKRFFSSLLPTGLDEGTYEVLRKVFRMSSNRELKSTLEKVGHELNFYLARNPTLAHLIEDLSMSDHFALRSAKQSERQDEEKEEKIGRLRRLLEDLDPSQTLSAALNL